LHTPVLASVLQEVPSSCRSSDDMKGYSSDISENCASARLEGVNASYKDLAQVCGTIRSKKTEWALAFLEKAAEGKAAVRYKTHNTRIGHRRELGGKKGRYPQKAAKIVLKVLRSAIANGKTKGLGETYTIRVATANKKDIYPRLASKGRWARSFLETSRVEIILQGEEIPKGVTVTPPKKPEKPEEKPKKEEKKAEKKEEKKAEAKEKPKEEKEAEKKEEKEERPPPKILKKEGQRHSTRKKEKEKQLEHEKTSEDKPHQHGEHSKR